MSNIHIALLQEDGSYATPVPILGAKSCEATFEIAEKNISADNKVVYNSKKVASGSGTLSVLGLTAEERRMLLGGDENVGWALRSGTDTPSMALLFQQEKADGKKILNVIYNVKFNPMSIQATSIEEGQIEEELCDLEFVAIEKPGDNIFYFAVDTAEAGAEALAQVWFTEVQEPQA